MSRSTVNPLAVLAPGSHLSPSPPLVSGHPSFVHYLWPFFLLSSTSLNPQDLLKVLYMEENTAALMETEGSVSVSTEKTDGQTAETRTGIRTICVSPDGKHLASGDRNGMLRYGTGREWTGGWLCLCRVCV